MIKLILNFITFIELQDLWHISSPSLEVFIITRLAPLFAKRLNPEKGMIVGSKSNQAFCQVLQSLSSASAWPKKLKFLNCTQIESQITITELKRGWMCFSSVLFSRRVSGSDNDNSPAKENQLSSVAGIFICSIYFCHMVISPVLFIFLF